MGEAKHRYDHQSQAVKIRLDPTADQILLNVALGVIAFVQATHIRLARWIDPCLTETLQEGLFIYPSVIGIALKIILDKVIHLPGHQASPAWIRAYAGFTFSQNRLTHLGYLGE